MLRQRDRIEILALLLALVLLHSVQAFQSAHRRQPSNAKSLFPRQQPQAVYPTRGVKPLFIFGRNKEDDNNASEEEDGKKKFSIPFFGRPTGEKEQQDAQQSEPAPKASVATIEKPKRDEDANDPAFLRAKAERARLVHSFPTRRSSDLDRKSVV